MAVDAGNAVEVRITANAEGMRRGANEAKSHVDGLVGVLKEFKSEQVSQARTARFFAQELLEIVPAAEGAKNAIQGIIGIGLSGGGMAAAFEGILFAAKAIGAAWHENGEAIKKATSEAATAIAALDDKVKAYIASTKRETEAEKLRREVIEPLELEAAQLRAKLIALTDKQAQAQDRLNRVQKEAHVLISSQTLETQGPSKEIRESTAALALLQARLANANVEMDRILGADRSAQWKKSSADFAESWGKAVDQQMADDEKLLNEEAEKSKQWVEMKQKAIEEYAASWGKLVDQQMADDEKLLNMEADAARKRIAEHARFVKGMVGELGRSFSEAFKGIIHGTMDVTEALKNIGLGVVDAVIDALVKMAEQWILSAAIGQGAMAQEAIASTSGHIAAAVAGAAESQAFIPFAGPALATEAAATMLATLTMMTAPLLAVASAAGGMMVPHDMLAMVHEDERILPAQYSEGLDRMVMNGGGGDIHVHIHGAIDGQSVQRVVESQPFLRAIREAARNGRL